jgi:hypothetical protein
MPLIKEALAPCFSSAAAVKKGERLTSLLQKSKKPSQPGAALSFKGFEVVNG